MKNQFILILLAVGFSSCSAFRPGTSSTTSATPAYNYSGSSGKSATQLKFISGISTGERVDVDNAVVRSGSERRSIIGTDSKKDSRERFSDLQFKYAILTNTAIERLDNEKLLDFMDEWYGVPYHYGGTGKSGIDCSAFASLMLSDVFQVNDLPRVSRDQYRESRRIPKSELRVGDLVFFHTLGKGHSVTHVGVYLYNNRFIHASIAGVQINDLSEGYYAHHFVGAGRVVPDSLID
jgi:lipoprotein Spr